MCTSIVEIAGIDGEGKGDNGRWFHLTRAVVAYDHPHHALLEDAICIDFVNHELEPGARVAVEITLESAKAFCAALQSAIAEAEETQRTGYRRVAAG